MPEDYVVFYSFDLDDGEFKDIMKNARRKLEIPMPAAMPCKTSLCRSGRETFRTIGGHKTKYACIVEADKSLRIRMEGALHKDHEDHIAWKGINSLNHYNLVHEFVPMPKAMKIPDAKAAVDTEWSKLEKIPAWQLTKVRNETEVIDEARKEGKTVHFASWIDICHLKNSDLEPQIQKNKGRVVLRGDIAKDDSGSCAVFTQQSSSASQLTAAKVTDVIAWLPGCAGQAADAAAHTQGQSGRCTSGREPFQRLHRTFRRLRQKRATANEQESQIEELMESDVMDGSRHQKSRDVCDAGAVMDAEGSQHQKPRGVCAIEEVMNDEGSLHQKTKEVCIMEDAESVVLGWSHEVEPCGRWASVIGSHLAHLRQEFKKGFGEIVADVMDAEVDGEDEIHPSRRPRVAERVAAHVPPEVEPQNLDFDVNESLRSSQNPVVASVFGDCEMTQRAAVRRGYPVMRSRFLNIGDDIHGQLVRERITSAIQRIPPRLLILAFPSRVWSPILHCATSLWSGLTENER